MNQPLVGIVMGSESDLKIMKDAAELLQQFGIPFELTVVSAHRSPERLSVYGSTAAGRGLKVIIAGAGGAAHLPGMLAAFSVLPVIGVPVKSSNSLDGWDSLLSIAQMPSGVPVATVAVNGAKNAGLLAVQILATQKAELQQKLVLFKKEQLEKVDHSIREIKIAGFPNFFDE